MNWFNEVWCALGGFILGTIVTAFVMPVREEEEDESRL